MPENENENKPKKKNGFLRAIIIILIVLLALVMGGYALAQYYGTPAWLSGILPVTETAAPAATPTPDVKALATVPPTPARQSPAPVETTPAFEEAAPEESPVPESPVSSDEPAPVVTATPYLGADAAAEAALKHCKVSEKDADISSVLLVEQNGMMLYAVTFSTRDFQYEYYLDAGTGRVESWRKAALADEEDGRRLFQVGVVLFAVVVASECQAYAVDGVVLMLA